jgi:hypothetical protein
VNGLTGLLRSLLGIRQPYDSYRNQGGSDREQDADDPYTADGRRGHRRYGDEQASGQAQPQAAQEQVTGQLSNLIPNERYGRAVHQGGPAEYLAGGNSADK